MRLVAALSVVLSLGTAACGDRDPSATDAGPDAPAADGGADADAGEAPGYLTSLASTADLALLTLAATGGEVKYLAPVSGRAPVPGLPAACYFQNMNRYSWHLLFLRSFPELADLAHDGYLALVLRKPSRRLWAGAVKPWPTVLHPRTGAPGVMAYSIYGEDDSVDGDAVREVDAALRACITFAPGLLVFVPETPQQAAMLMAERAALAADGVASLFPQDLVPGIDHLAHSAGEGYGTLRVVPAGQPLRDYGPRDVVIVESAPNDISVVAGLITRNPQNVLGHVNLRLREKQVPNVTVPRIYEASWVRALEGQLVHLQADDTRFTLEAATLAAAQAFWDAHRPQVRPPVADLDVTALASFRTLRATDARGYGAKAANLGELTRVLDPPNRSEGFGIPFAHHRDLLRDTGLGADLATLLADPRLRTDAAFKRAQLKALRDRIKGAPFPPALFADLQAVIAQVFGAAGRTTKLRFRSSTNVEDLDSFTGAGLYDSKSGCLADDLDGDDLGPSACLSAAEQTALQAALADRRAELAAHPERSWLADIIDDLAGDVSEERPVRDAVRKVWASLWNERAFDEREYYGLDHRLAHMGIAVNPAFVLERASAVALSNLRVDDGPPLYRLNSQAGSESVVRPEDPTVVAELLTFRREGDPPAATRVGIQVRSSLLPDGATVWPAETLPEVARLLFRAHDHFATHVYPQITPLRLDFELKHDADGRVVCKQVRPFASSEP
jgi:pyruvate, water dikinase